MSLLSNARVIAASIVLAYPLQVSQVIAATTGTFQVSADIVRGCAVDGLGMSGTTGKFGKIDFGSTSALSPSTQTASLSGSQVIVLRCTPGISLNVTLNGGEHADPGVRNLQRSGLPATRLNYRLYSDAGLTTEYVINQARAITVPSASANGVTLPIHGRIVLSGGHPSGTYSDIVVVTLNW